MTTERYNFGIGNARLAGRRTMCPLLKMTTYIEPRSVQGRAFRGADRRLQRRPVARACQSDHGYWGRQRTWTFHYSRFVNSLWLVNDATATVRCLAISVAENLRVLFRKQFAKFEELPAD